MADVRTVTMTQQEFWDNHPDEYVPPGREVPKPDVPGPFRDPREWIGEINPDRDHPGRKINCGECARATELSWRGVPAVSARLADLRSGGEVAERMEEWSGADLRPATFADIAADLEAAGPGSSAVVAVYWKWGGGHWFNAVNHNGDILAVDGQKGSVERWPPSRGMSGYDESWTQESYAVSFDRHGDIDGSPGD
ncbi:toxin glutamine deamidase domain-containing protein [Frankia sp. AgPm24]|nr:toxin glutamine deamidase domain-containing protein [Frankia sp. AgPm24]